MEKEYRLNIRLNSEYEKKSIKNKSKKAGFNTVSAWVMWLIRREK